VNVSIPATGASKPFNKDDLAVWPDGFWAVLKDVWNGHYSYRSDDYEMVHQDNHARLIELGVEEATAVTKTDEAANAYVAAVGAAIVRELRWAILFASAEPDFFPPAYDEDTGEFAPVPNYRPASRVSCLTAKAQSHPVAARILAQAGWTEDTDRADLATMLKCLPRHTGNTAMPECEDFVYRERLGYSWFGDTKPQQNRVKLTVKQLADRLQSIAVERHAGFNNPVEGNLRTLRALHQLDCLQAGID
jgi:hypothetical protein